MARALDPLEFRGRLSPDELDNPRAGNRFDSPDAAYGVLYFATRLQGCFVETLARFKPDPALARLVRHEWSDLGFMAPGNVPAEWRVQRTAVRVSLGPPENLFLDVESPDTHRVLERQGEIREVLASLGLRDIDVGVVRGGDRRLTRAISRWAWSQATETGGRRYAGIRYLSRLGDEWECWAVFEGVPLTIEQQRPIRGDMDELREVANHYAITVH